MEIKNFGETQSIGVEIMGGNPSKKPDSKQEEPVNLAKRFTQIKTNDVQLLDVELNKLGYTFESMQEFPYEDVSEDQQKKLYSLLGDFQFYTDPVEKSKILKELVSQFKSIYNS
jgi:hypothetical protein